MTCPYCTGSHFLNDTPGLGPCVCCTPEALEAAEVEAAGLQEQLDHANERLMEAWDRILENPDVRREGKSLAEATDEALDFAYAKGEGERLAATDAFRSYLVSIGLSANPVTLADPHLQAMADALF